MADVFDPTHTFWAHYDRRQRIDTVGDQGFLILRSDKGSDGIERGNGIIGQARANP